PYLPRNYANFGFAALAGTRNRKKNRETIGQAIARGGGQDGRSSVLATLEDAAGPWEFLRRLRRRVCYGFRDADQGGTRSGGVRVSCVLAAGATCAAPWGGLVVVIEPVSRGAARSLMKS